MVSRRGGGGGSWQRLTIFDMTTTDSVFITMLHASVTLPGVRYLLCLNTFKSNK